MDITRLRDDRIIPALALVVLRIGSAMTLRPLGFLGSATLFLMLGAMIPVAISIGDPASAQILLSGVCYGALFGG